MTEALVEGVGGLRDEVDTEAARALERLGDEAARDSPAPMRARDGDVGEEGLDLAVAEHVGESDDLVAVDRDDRRHPGRGERAVRTGRVLGERRPTFGNAERDDPGQVGIGIFPVLHPAIVGALQ